jgi:hypothetical protein
VSGHDPKAPEGLPNAIPRRADLIEIHPSLGLFHSSLNENHRTFSLLIGAPMIFIDRSMKNIER